MTATRLSRTMAILTALAGGWACSAEDECTGRRRTSTIADYCGRYPAYCFGYFDPHPDNSGIWWHTLGCDDVDVYEFHMGPEESERLVVMYYEANGTLIAADVREYHCDGEVREARYGDRRVDVPSDGAVQYPGCCYYDAGLVGPFNGALPCDEEASAGTRASSEGVPSKVN